MKIGLFFGSFNPIHNDHVGVVKTIFKTLKQLEDFVIAEYPTLERYLPEEIKFVTSEELLQMYPGLSHEERENEICKKHKAVFVSQIGGILKDGKPHGKRAPDYDNWEMNGDILLWFPILNKALEISSMGIRVDEKSLLRQLEISNCMDRICLPYHESVLAAKLPYTIGGGIGQSRLCMFFLNKAHIGEVQSSAWSDEILEACKKNGINLL